MVVTAVFAYILHCILVVSATLVSFWRLCAFLLHRWFAFFFLRESFSTAHSPVSLFFLHLSRIFAVTSQRRIFSQMCCSFPMYLFLLCSYPHLFAGLHPLLQALISPYNKLQPTIITPQRHHLFSSCCFMLCVSALANLSTPLSRRGAFLCSGHISALMFCAFSLRIFQ